MQIIKLIALLALLAVSASEAGTHQSWVSQLFESVRDSDKLPIEITNSEIKERLIEIGSASASSFADPQFSDRLLASLSKDDRNIMVVVADIENRTRDPKELADQIKENRKSDGTSSDVLRPSGYRAFYLKIDENGQSLGLSFTNNQDGIPWIKK